MEGRPVKEWRIEIDIETKTEIIWSEVPKDNSWSRKNKKLPQYENCPKLRVDL